jgi:hypothetical protein
MFQKRLSWMLSSLINQNKLKNYDINFDLAYCETEESNPTISSIVKTFSNKGINIIERKYPNYERMQFRGFVRNDQIKDCKTEYMLFADCDMVYHPAFFRKLFHTLNEDEYKGYTGVMTCGRFSNPIEGTNSLVDAEDYTSSIIEDPWGKADTLSKIRRSNVGAGFFQLFNHHLAPHEDYYVAEESNRDYGWYDGKKNIQKARSDQQFRRHIGDKKKLPRWYSRSQIHLNHSRDNQVNYHLETQR